MNIKERINTFVDAFFITWNYYKKDNEGVNKYE